MTFRAAAVAVGALVLGLAEPASAADVRRLEAVGSVPVKPDQRGTVSTLDAAIQSALREAVSRVARSFLMDADVPEGAEEGVGENLDEVLGKRMVPYTTRFRILDDQGERVALFVEDPEVSTEYVVIVEVYVDAERVEQRLVEAGLLIANAEVAETSRIPVEVRGLRHYPAYVAMAELIRGPGRAVAVHPIGFARGVAVFRVELALRESAEEGAVDPTPFVRRLIEAGPPTLVIEPLQIAPDGVVLEARWTPPPPEGEEEPGPQRVPGRQSD